MYQYWPNTHILIADVDDTSLLNVLGAEFVCEGLEHDTRLNKVVKIDVARSTSVKGSNHQLGKLR
jgi:hypothetical protein